MGDFSEPPLDADVAVPSTQSEPASARDLVLEAQLGRSDHSPSRAPSSEDFLFHLYRGNELLQDDCVGEAKEELERALLAQPGDIEARGLLGLACFRLGLYSRAIELYHEILVTHPGATTPWINLALCYLSTGQSELARQALQAVVAREPDHARAWGYLGLVFERLGDHSEAQAAFERAQQPRLAPREVDRTDQQAADPESGGPVAGVGERDEVRRVAAEVAHEFDVSERPFVQATESLPSVVRSPQWRTIEPGAEARPSGRATSFVGRLGPAVPSIPELLEFNSLSRSSVRALVAGVSHAPMPVQVALGRHAHPPPSGITVLPAGSVLLRVEIGLAVRGAALRAASPLETAFKSRPLMRRVRGRETADPLGGPGAPWVLVEGRGSLLIAAGHARQLSSFELSGSFIYVRENCLVGFTSTARYETGRLPAGGGEPLPMVQITGRGLVLVESRRTLDVLAVSGDHQVVVRAEDVVGWMGRLLGQPVDAEVAPARMPGFVGFSGSGSVFLDLG